MKTRHFFFKIVVRAVARFNNWRYPHHLKHYQGWWSKIDHRKDKSLSAYDFRLWVYLRENERLLKKLGFLKSWDDSQK